MNMHVGLNPPALLRNSRGNITTAAGGASSSSMVSNGMLVYNDQGTTTSTTTSSSSAGASTRTHHRYNNNNSNTSTSTGISVCVQQHVAASTAHHQQYQHQPANCNPDVLIVPQPGVNLKVTSTMPHQSSVAQGASPGDAAGGGASFSAAGGGSTTPVGASKSCSPASAGVLHYASSSPGRLNHASSKRNEIIEDHPPGLSVTRAPQALSAGKHLVVELPHQKHLVHVQQQKHHIFTVLRKHGPVLKRDDPHQADPDHVSQYEDDIMLQPFYYEEPGGPGDPVLFKNKLPHPPDTSTALLESLSLQLLYAQQFRQGFDRMREDLSAVNRDFLLEQMHDLIQQLNSCVIAWAAPLRSQGCTPAQRMAILEYNRLIQSLYMLQKHNFLAWLRAPPLQVSDVGSSAPAAVEAHPRTWLQKLLTVNITAQTALLGALQGTMNGCTVSDDENLALHQNICMKMQEFTGEAEPTPAQEAIALLYAASTHLLEMERELATDTDPLTQCKKYFTRLEERLEDWLSYLSIKDYIVEDGSILQLFMFLKTGPNAKDFAPIQIRAVHTRKLVAEIWEKPPENGMMAQGNAGEQAQPRDSSSTSSRHMSIATSAASSCTNLSSSSALLAPTSSVQSLGSFSATSSASTAVGSWPNPQTAELAQQLTVAAAVAKGDGRVAGWLRKLNEFTSTNPREQDVSVSFVEFLFQGFQLWKREFHPFAAQLEQMQRRAPKELTAEDKERAHDVLCMDKMFSNLLNQLGPEGSAELLSAFRQQTFLPGEEVFVQGDRGEEFFVVVDGVAHVYAHEQNYLKVGDKVRNTRDVHFGGRRIPVGSNAMVDKFDPQREYPYTIRIVGTGQRGRILACEVEAIDGPPREDFIASLRASDYFGEQAVLKNCARSATVKASPHQPTPLTVLVLNRDAFYRYKLHDKLQFVRRKALVAMYSSKRSDTNNLSPTSSLHEDEALELCEGERLVPSKSEQELQFITTAIRNNGNLSELVNPSEEQLSRLANAAFRRAVSADATVITEGEVFADRFYIIEAGEFCYFKGERKVGDIAKAGASFGELGLLYHQPRAATVKCVSKNGGILWVLSRSAFKAELVGRENRKVQENLEIVSEIDTFYGLISEERQRLAENVTEVRFQKNEYITKEGEAANLFYILKKGSIRTYGARPHLTMPQQISASSTTSSSTSTSTTSATNLNPSSSSTSPGAQAAGEDGAVETNKAASGQRSSSSTSRASGSAGASASSAQNAAGRTSSSSTAVQTTTPGQTGATGDAPDYQIVTFDRKNPYWFGERALLRDEARTITVIAEEDDTRVLVLQKAQFKKILAPVLDLVGDIGFVSRQNVGCVKKNDLKSNIQLDDLNRIGLLGCGGFGAVTLEQHAHSGKTYALKALSKGYVVKMKMQKGVLREKEILSLCDSQFVIRLHATFRTAEYLYFLLEPALGGELFAVYHKYRFHGSVSKARFYSASVVFALEHLHERNVLYRDLKPENLLLESRGFCKLTDMGLAKIVYGKTYTTCGTPDYFAPEVVRQMGMTKAVDWWTLGILVHELLSGHAPFEANDQMETYQKICKGHHEINFQAYKDRDPDAVDLVRQLLQEHPHDRLPMKGLRNLRLHKWYSRFDWEALYRFEMRPPHVPKVRDDTDLGNFRAAESDLPPQIAAAKEDGNWDKDF
ncbi:unnamed protein product [Amoebophrya sp. A120]|nr:unnamed protein product [Amoebophrya sp. A120]|eukprot:GSA120T00012044001.1